MTKITDENMREAEKLADLSLIDSLVDQAAMKKMVIAIAAALQSREDKAAKLVEALKDVLGDFALHKIMGDYARGHLAHGNYLNSRLAPANEALAAYEGKTP